MGQWYKKGYYIFKYLFSGSKINLLNFEHRGSMYFNFLNKETNEELKLMEKIPATNLKQGIIFIVFSDTHVELKQSILNEIDNGILTKYLDSV